MSNNGWTTRETVDYSNVNPDGPTPLDEGIYWGKIVSAEATTSAKGSPCIKLVFEVERDYAGNVPQGKFMKAYTTVPVQAKTAFRILQIANVFGLTAPMILGYEEISEFANGLVDKSSYARMTQREYDGRVSNNLDRFLTNDKAAEEASGGDKGSTPESIATPRKSRRAA